MPRWARNQDTGRTVENCKAHPDGIPCPSCGSTRTKFKFLNNKKKTQPRYQCLECKQRWTVGGRTRAPYNTRNRAVSNPEVADTTPQPPTTAASQPPTTTTAAVRRRQRVQALKALIKLWKQLKLEVAVEDLGEVCDSEN